MRFLSRQDLEAISQRVLQVYWKLPEAKKSPERVNPSILLTHLLGLKLDFRRLSFDGQVLGMTSFCEIYVELDDCDTDELYYLDGKTVLIDSRLRETGAIEGRKNFTIAHEGSHHILNMLFPGDYSGGTKARSVLRYRASPRHSAHRSEEEWEEWQMDVLSSAILMPQNLLRSHLAAANLPNGIQRLNRVFDSEAFKSFANISEIMGVSKQALAYRMERLGLLKENHLQNPYAFLEIWKDEDDDG